MRKFGVELELIGSAAARGNALVHAAGIIQGLGIRARTNSYAGRDYAVFQCKSDSSLAPQDRAVEVVSPIMPANPDSYEIVRRVVTALDEQGYGINRSCGMHVHINVADLSVRDRMLVVLRYAEMQDEINHILPPSRRSNAYCAPLSDREGLERAITSGSMSWRNGHGRHSESVNTAFLHESDARLEFRQAGGTCNPAKVINWIKFLQEMIDEVVRRAAGAVFAGATRPPAQPVPYRPAPTPVARNPLASVPRMREGSDAHRAMMQLCTHGVVTTAWAETNGIGPHVLRRIIVGFRRHGAQLTTVSSDAGPRYMLTGVVALPVRPESIFVGDTSAPIAPTHQAAALEPIPVAPVSTITPAVLVRYGLTEGLSPATAEWVRDRRDTFNADRPAAA